MPEILKNLSELVCSDQKQKTIEEETKSIYSKSDPLKSEYLRVKSKLVECKQGEFTASHVKYLKPKHLSIHAKLFKLITDEERQQYAALGGFQTPGGIEDFDFTTNNPRDLAYRVKYIALEKKF